MKKINFYFLSKAIVGLILFFASSQHSFAQNDWKVWVKTSPCSGRFDWITVAKENPTSSGLSFYSAANDIFPGRACTTGGCSFKEATRIANSLRPSPVFSQYCCKDYSVWRQSSTGNLTIVQGKFNTAGEGWTIEKADLCCEEAETIAGLPGACSGGTTAPPVTCAPGSHPVYNQQTKRTECFCNTGLIWNSTRTACIKSKDTSQVKCFPGSHPAADPQTGKTLCYCDEGLVWNDTRTACVPPSVKCYPGSHAAINPATGKTECFCDAGLVWNQSKTACVPPAGNCYPGSHAAINPATGKTECYCDAGLVWNDSKTACVLPAVQCYPGSHAAINPATGKTECYCDAGLVWNAGKTACVPPAVNCFPGSHAAVDPQTGKTLCYCDAGLVWNDTKTACVPPAVNCFPGSHAAVDPQTGKTLCYCDAGLVWNASKTACVSSGGGNNGGGATWHLVETITHPDKPIQGWSFNAGGTAHMDVYQGDKADFQWTPPPASFGKDGFTITLTATAQPIPKGRMAIILGARGFSMDSETPSDQRYLSVNTEDGKAASQSKSIRFTPSGSPDEIIVEVGMMWGAVWFNYKYKKD